MTGLRLTGGRVVTPDGVLESGTVVVDGGRIVSVGAGPDQGGGDVVVQTYDLAGLLVLPGFIDLHVHGGGGATFDEGAASIATGLATHRANGTTRSLVSLVTAPAGQMAATIAVAAAYAATDPGVLGLHLEGPFLSVDRRGVHDPASLLMPDPLLLQRFLDAGAGSVRVVTVAPELPGGLDLVRQLVADGVHAAVGHSDAGYDVALQAFRVGADLVTHAFNGMRPLHHRDPAIIGAAMDAGVVLEAINDGVHLHDATVRLLRSIAPGRIALITDAMGATCAADGQYRLGAFDVQVTGGEARLANGTIAGSTLTMGAAVKRAVQQVGMSLVEAASAASLVPATLLGVADRFGSLRPGRAADLVVTDADLNIRAVMISGEWNDDRRP
ncbi:N-acetylglucosamine-6-phosphate deacetylase [Nakamurella sp. PAMC28650]|uniref:N-acetylglucosamine-6-phosphate deacetylase n=1 Tax=Nakamurella sp. PAMC28650 TaxID=2762325 RepID=UPI00164E7027|nr:N-acetylglucosamine-6-phosphate deacetylase [Nakamurella sp. PAMC28650]QNK83035.1 N-acetylglucosamine-6-phosphate deacetylase [Nakamurella sp. PAMC28650]